MIHLFRFFLPVILTILGLVIAYQQYLINRQVVKINLQKVKWDLFEKRYRIYRLMKELLLEINENNTMEFNKLRDFKFSIRDRVFLFENDINEYIDTFIKNVNNIRSITEKVTGYAAQLKFNESQTEIKDEWTKYSNKQMEESKWFSDEYGGGIEDKFMRYLDFRDLI